MKSQTHEAYTCACTFFRGISAQQTIEDAIIATMSGCNVHIPYCPSQ